MRVYIPAVGTDLVDDRPPVVPAFTAVVPEGASSEDAEVMEDDAQTEAALSSLLRLREADGAEAGRRIVLAADIDADRVSVVDPDDPTSPISGVTPGQLSWSDVRAILVDGPGAEDAVRDVLAAEDQDAADEAVAALWEHSLEWFDISERHFVIAAGTTHREAPSSAPPDHPQD